MNNLVFVTESGSRYKIFEEDGRLFMSRLSKKNMVLGFEYNEYNSSHKNKEMRELIDTQSVKYELLERPDITVGKTAVMRVSLGDRIGRIYTTYVESVEIC